MRMAILVLVLAGGCGGCLGDGDNVEQGGAREPAPPDAANYGKYIPIDARVDAVYVDAECPLPSPCYVLSGCDSANLTQCGEYAIKEACWCAPQSRWCVP